MPQDLVVIGPRGQVPFGDEKGSPRPWKVLQLTEPLDSEQPWCQMAPALMARFCDWESCGLVLTLTDGVTISADHVTELFRLMRAHDLTLAQPSLSWNGDAIDITTRQMPSFLFRRTSCVDSAALAMSSTQMRDMLPLMAALPAPALIARLLPACQSDPMLGATVIDAVQALREPRRLAREPLPPVWPEPLRRGGSHLDGAFTWSGQTVAGLYLGLLDESSRYFIGQLALDLASLGLAPELIGQFLMAHSTRSHGARPLPVQTADSRRQPGIQLPFGRLKPSPIAL